MGILKDWKEETEGYYFSTRVRDFFSPRVWFRLRKWRVQRADRGWSDRDTWGAGEHIAQMIAEMLQHLNDKTYTDWPEWFKLNVKEEGKGAYKDLQSVIDDINNYLEWSKTSWADDLDTTPDQPRTNEERLYIEPDWYEIETGRKLTKAAVRNRIYRHHEQGEKLYKKANKAIGFFGRHFASFWD